MPTTPTLRGPRVRLRPLKPADLEALTALRAEPGVRRWWGALRPGDLEPPSDGDLLAIDVDGAVAGAISYEEVTDPQYHSAGIDIFLGAAARQSPSWCAT
jgi:aminoglycoside 6'-N-acetyltransferase